MKGLRTGQEEPSLFGEYDAITTALESVKIARTAAPGQRYLIERAIDNLVSAQTEAKATIGHRVTTDRSIIFPTKDDD